MPLVCLFCLYKSGQINLHAMENLKMVLIYTQKTHYFSNKRNLEAGSLGVMIGTMETS